MADDPKPGSYRPFVAARYPASGRPPAQPAWRVLVHRQHLNQWTRILEICGQSNAEELWGHLTTRPDQPPHLGTVTPMKGRRYAAKDGMSRVYHYEVTGAARVDYRFNPEYRVDGGDRHQIVQIVSISLGSH